MSIKFYVSNKKIRWKEDNHKNNTITQYILFA